MDFEDVRSYLETNHRGVIATRRTERRDTLQHRRMRSVQRARGLRVGVPAIPEDKEPARDPNCTVLAVSEDWRQWVSVEGQATLYDYGNTEAEEFRVMLREVYMTCSDTEHPDWDEYDQAMIDQEAVIVLVSPERVYGLVR